MLITSLLNIAGLLKNKVIQYVVIALVAFWGAFYGLSYLSNHIRETVVQEQTIEQLQLERDTRKKVDNVLQENRKSNPGRDGSIALDRLRKTYNRDSSE